MAAAAAHHHVVDARLAHELLLARAVLLRPALEVEVMEGADDLPQVGLAGVALLAGEPAHHLTHDATMLQVKRV